MSKPAPCRRLAGADLKSVRLRPWQMIASRPAIRCLPRGVGRQPQTSPKRPTPAASLLNPHGLPALTDQVGLGYLICGPPSRDADRSKSLSRQQVVSEQLIERLRPPLRKKNSARQPTRPAASLLESLPPAS